MQAKDEINSSFLNDSLPKMPSSQSDLQCSICFHPYDETIRKPMSMCISDHVVCLACAKHIGGTSSKCPFCKRLFNFVNPNPTLMERLIGRSDSEIALMTCSQKIKICVKSHWKGLIQFITIIGLITMIVSSYLAARMYNCQYFNMKTCNDGQNIHFFYCCEISYYCPDDLVSSCSLLSKMHEFGLWYMYLLSAIIGGVLFMAGLIIVMLEKFSFDLNQES